MRGKFVRAAVAVLAVGTVTGVAACGSGSSSSSGGGGGGGSSSGSKGGKIALLLPETKTARYEAADRPYFTQKVQSLCSGCDIIYSNADQDAAKQQSQAEAAITQGAKVLVLDPVDSASAAGIAKRAKQSNIPVISYDRLITGAPVDYYISFDNVQVGKLQGQSLLEALGGTGKSIVMINGSPQDNNAKLFKQGAHSVLDGKVKVAKEYDTPDWSPDKAQQEMEQAITAVGKSGIQGVYAANDGTAGGAIAAMKGNGVDPTKVPVTGQDAEVAGVQRILVGDQYAATFWNSVRVSVVYTGVAVAVKLVLGMCMALLLNERFRGRTLMRAILFLPWAMPTIIVALTWRWIYDGSLAGLINFVRVEYFGQDDLVQFLANPSLALWSVVVVAVWQGTPFFTMMFLAAMQAIPSEQYEAAALDGANAVRRFTDITLPSLGPAITITALLSTIWTANSINFIFALTRGGPVGATMTFPMLAYEVGIAGARQLGLAAAVSVLFFPVFIVAIYVLTKRMLSTEGRA
jgi:D-xylose transport system substrate-binding protein